MPDSARIRVIQPDVPEPPAHRLSHHPRSIQGTPPTYRWECPCQVSPVLLATCDATGRVNIKVRDRYWHLFGFGQVHAICPRCAAEHVLDLRSLREAFDGPTETDHDLAG